MEYSPYSPSAAADGPAPAPARGSGNLAAVLLRIEEAVEEETAAIGADLRFDLQASNTRKSRCLYDLARATRGLASGDLEPEHRDGLLRLREKLSRNERAIRAHLDAVGEVAALLQTAIAEGQSDGTYAALGWRS